MAIKVDDLGIVKLGRVLRSAARQSGCERGQEDAMGEAEHRFWFYASCVAHVTRNVA